MNEAVNKFQRHDAKRSAERAAVTISRDDAVAARDKRRESWTQHGRGQAGGGLLLDQRVLSAKAAAIAERNKPHAQATVMTDRSIQAIVERWAEQVGFYSSEFNKVSLRNRLREQVDAGIPFSYELLDQANDFLRRNNHLEQPPNAIRKRGGVVSSAVPTLYEYVPQDEQAVIDEEQAKKAIEARAKEDAENKNLSMDELRKRAAAARGVISRESIRVYQG
jgi:uncharacterized small protein (DUF1192 family)